jgi:hypothetical protein
VECHPRRDDRLGRQHRVRSRRGATDPAEDGYEAGCTGGGSFYANDNLGAAVSTNPGGDEGYIGLGDGEFVRWG